MKRKIWILFAVAGCVVISILCFFWFQSINRSPLERYNFENCRIGVLGYGCTEVLEYLSDEQCEEFVGILLSAQLSEKAISAIGNETNGDYGGFRIELQNGDVLLLRQQGKYLVFNLKAYECYNSVGGKLWQYLNNVYKRHYPVNQTGDSSTS